MRDLLIDILEHTEVIEIPVIYFDPIKDFIGPIHTNKKPCGGIEITAANYPEILDREGAIVNKKILYGYLTNPDLELVDVVPHGNTRKIIFKNKHNHNEVEYMFASREYGNEVARNVKIKSSIQYQIRCHVDDRFTKLFEDQCKIAKHDELGNLIKIRYDTEKLYFDWGDPVVSKTEGRISKIPLFAEEMDLSALAGISYWYYDTKLLLPILKTKGEKNISLNENGAMQIMVSTKHAVYEYNLAGQCK